MAIAVPLSKETFIGSLRGEIIFWSAEHSFFWEEKGEISWSDVAQTRDLRQGSMSILDAISEDTADAAHSSTLILESYFE